MSIQSRFEVRKLTGVLWSSALVLWLAASLAAAQTVELETDSIKKDYAAELPRIPRTEPADSLKKFQIADGFRIELAAHEPLVSDPIAMAFDELGRLFVVCMRGYSEDDDQNLGVIRLLEDTDGDGVFDRGSDYATGLSWPTAIACYDGGVFIGAAPDVIWCKDVDGDGVADVRRVVFTGFGKKNVQGMLNSFRWGFNNRIYGAAGLNGGQVGRPANQESTGDDVAINLRGRDFSFDPATLAMRPESGGAQHGATFTRWGDRLVCSNSDHVQWIAAEDHHLRRNPFHGTRARESIAVDGAAAEVYRTSDVEPWRIVRTRLRVKGMVGGPVEGGGRASGYFTSASGITAYTGDSFPVDFKRHDFLFVGDVGSNLVHLKKIETHGYNKRAVRATEQDMEFLTSTDNWFRPVQFANGPDGCMYLLDMYREVIEHPWSLPPMIKQHLDLTSGRDRGRIYRITTAEWKHANRPWPGEANETQLVAMLEHENGWHRETAARLISTRIKNAGGSIPKLSRLLSNALESASPHARIRALYCLLGSVDLKESQIVARLKDEHPEVRRHALKVVEAAKRSQTRETRQLAGALTASQFNAMTDDQDPSVRYQLALTLGEFDASQRVEPLIELARESANEPRLRSAILSAIGDQRITIFRELRKADASNPLLGEIAKQIGKNQSELAIALELLSDISDPNELKLFGHLLLGTGRRAAELQRLLNKSGAKPELLKNAIQKAGRLARNPSRSTSDRLFAARVLALAEYENSRASFEELLAAHQPAAIRNGVIDCLGVFRSTETAKTLLRSLPSLPPQGRHKALQALTSRTFWATELLNALQQEEISASQITAVHRERLLRHNEPSVAEAANRLLGKSIDREQVNQHINDLLTKAGDVTRGREHFRKICASCHRLDGMGANIGPDLQPLRKRGATFLVTNILDPNREIDPRYEAYSVVTTDGRSINGLLQQDTDTLIRLHQADGALATIAKSDVETLQATGRSLMPEGLERDLGDQGIADVIAFLVHTKDPSSKSRP